MSAGALKGDGARELRGTHARGCFGRFDGDGHSQGGSLRGDGTWQRGESRSPGSGRVSASKKTEQKTRVVARPRGAWLWGREGGCRRVGRRQAKVRAGFSAWKLHVNNGTELVAQCGWDRTAVILSVANWTRREGVCPGPAVLVADRMSAVGI